MTDEQIVKALEICSDKLTISCPDDCPFYDECEIDLCALERQALDLINRKDAKVELLTMDVNSLTSERDALQEMVKEQKAEIERLKAEIRNTDNTLASLDRPLIEVKHEAYRECVNRVKQVFGNNNVFETCVRLITDSILTELTEGGNEEPPKNDFKEEKIMEKLFKNNAEWLQFISDLKDLACYLRSEKVEMDANAELVDKAIELLVEWNPKRRESIERCSK